MHHTSTGFFVLQLEDNFTMAAPPSGLTTSLPEVISCKVAFLRKQGFDNFQEWAAQPGHVYIGRNMTQYIPGAVGSKWGNPFTHGSGMTLEERIESYEAMVRASPELMASLGELEGATQLGCWCAPNPCHGNVLVRLLGERRAMVEGSGRAHAFTVAHASDAEKLGAVGTDDASTPVVQPAVPVAVPEKRPKKKNRLQ
jgi:hypothetical protein